MDAILDQIKLFAASASDTGRHKLISALHDMAYSLETPDETLHRYGSMNLQAAVVKIGLDLKLFRILAEAENGVAASIKELSAKTGAEALLLGRLLRYLAAIGAVKQVSGNQFAASHVTKNLTERVAEAGVNHYFSTVTPQYSAFPGFLKKNGYRNPTDEVHTVFQDAWNTELHGFDWFTQHPENLAYFNDFMASRREPELSWLTVYPVAEQVSSADCGPERAVYVNVGGGIGHQCAEFKQKFPEMPGRVILQDMPHSIANALPTAGVENIVHDFFQPQPIKGAKFYFLRGVFHNHPPHKVLQLLAHTKAAMAADSVILIDEMIPPEMGAHVDALSMDLTMMTAFAGMERSESQWREILVEAGLQLIKTYVYNPASHESVMEVRLPAQ
ncbi:S-adenosyl-L-methionine-dependent methyltransferase [Melanomma pulvis-pyrius CBS 109.77]|uniref:S-adenosyl-L-methionine-dependent methyltransferase n=1 Tax=Melanomma pulvis-pyrius CBS 109.77 TaxID=1314802 RepID=A0A6A6X0W0_9PLEO|nr:S-adenosyl-L-methionine-dependent methyltransferase [Melanomma pulvis-pyrius CBS 109.77]